MSNHEKIAILGGSFNPITGAHIEIARYVFYRSDISCVWLMPCNNHLQKTGLEAFEHRFNMCEIAAKSFDFIKVSNWELTKGLDGSAYSLISKIKEDYASGVVCGPSEVELSYIIGMDQANNFHTWKNWEKLKDMVRFIVLPRDGVKEDPKVTWYLEKPHLYCPPLLGYPIMDVSSTKVRELIKRSRNSRYFRQLIEHLQTLANLLDNDVLEYIQKNGLYE